MNGKILIALKDIDLSKSIEFELKGLEYDIKSIQDGRLVLNSLREFMPDLLIFDTAISGMNGYDILNEKSYDRLITKIPVIIVSNSSSVLEIKKIPSTPTIKGFIVRAHIETNEVIDSVKKILNINKIIENKMQENNGKKVLWIEDDKLLSQILSKKINSAGFILLKASNEAETMQILDKDTPDIMLFDIMLPGINGLDLLQKIKTNEKFRKIPSIILSNTSSKEDIEKSNKLGAQKFLVKAAISLDEIISEIKSVLAK